MKPYLWVVATKKGLLEVQEKIAAEKETLKLVSFEERGGEGLR